MPWTVADVDKHKKGLTEAQKQQWVRIANSALSECIKKGGTDATCAPSAIRQANGVVGHSDMERFVQSNEAYTISQQMHQGRNHLIVPVVMMVEGVHNGSHGRLLHLAEDLGKFPEAWNGIPIVVDHPQDEEGHNISANSPDMAPRHVGRVFNTHIDDKKLKADAWVDEQLLRELSSEALAHIQTGQPLEVSVGVFTEEELTTGQYGDEEYVAIARNHRPDHLALLPGGVGACSWTDGCGIRVNEEVLDNFEPPESGDAPAGLKSILSRVYNSCRAKWVKDHPNDKENAANKESCSRIAWSAVKGAGWSKQGDKWVNAHAEVINHIGDGYKAIVDTLRQVIDGMDVSGRSHYLEEVYDGYVIYRVEGREGGGKLYRQNYQKNDGVIDFTGTPTEVKKKVEYVSTQNSSGTVVRTKFNSSINKSKEVNKMSTKDDNVTPCCEDLVKAIIANERTKFKDEHKEWLLTLEEAQLQLLIPEKEDTPPVTDPPVVNKEQAIQVLKESVSKPEDFFNILPEELRDSMRAGLKLYNEQRVRMITDIKATAKDVWTEDELKKMDYDSLLKTYKAVVKEVTDYSGLGTVQDNANEEKLLPPGVKEVEPDKK